MSCATVPRYMNMGRMHARSMGFSLQPVQISCSDTSSLPQSLQIGGLIGCRTLAHVVQIHAGYHGVKPVRLPHSTQCTGMTGSSTRDHEPMDIRTPCYRQQNHYCFNIAASSERIWIASRGVVLSGSMPFSRAMTRSSCEKSERLRSVCFSSFFAIA